MGLQLGELNSTFSPKALLVADNGSVEVIPIVITYGAKLVVEADLHSPLVRSIATGQSDLTILAFETQSCRWMVCVCTCV